MNCFCRLNQVDFGFAILGIFFKCGCTPKVSTFSALINGYVLEGNTYEAVNLFRRLIKYGDIEPDEIMYATIIKGLCKVGDTTMAIRLLRNMQKWNYRPDVVMYSTIIDNLCKDGNIDDALRLLSEMREWDIMPDVVTYSSLVDGLCKSGRGEDATRN
ncbi:putative pentatricopeptide repeat-containing protein At1g12700, mitochondrial [Rhododendron vialii]|uniref:putative pentatricopeptide repeat-containing protein At1g12700, mitochondrial n=1 Tax=Rhododendron vialii TaxID=182163 RepID=UPI00265F3CC7|nr:putative pentatricopeptide repeat-containing protein At1g12700, mitochondrial [Rhododendron vialii]